MKRPEPRVIDAFFQNYLEELKTAADPLPQLSSETQNPNTSGCALTVANTSGSADVTSLSFSTLSTHETSYQDCLEARRTSTPNSSNPFIDNNEETIIRNEINLTTEHYNGLSDNSPTLYVEAISGANKVEWLAAIKEELNAHKVNGTWEVVDRPNNAKILTARWVFVVKNDKDGNCCRFKARLVARGFEQVEGIDFTDSYAPVARIDSIRFLIALCAQESLHMLQFDISTAFLYGELDEIVYMHAPEGVKTGRDKCLLLKRSLYGLRQAPRAWHFKLSQTLKEIGFKPLNTEQCIFSDQEKQTFVYIYVDDCMICGRDLDKCTKIIDQLSKTFAIKDTTGSLFIGLNIERKDDGSIFVSQSAFANKLVSRFNMSDCIGSAKLNLNMADLEIIDDGQTTNEPYRSLIGALLYLAVASRPDLLFVTTYLSKFNCKPLEKHWRAAKTLLRYVKGTHQYGLHYSKQGNQLIAYSDADWAADRSDRRSVSGGIILYAGAPVVYFSRKQTAIALSSCEPELIAAGEVCKSLKWLSMLAEEMNLKLSTPMLNIKVRSA